MSDLANLETVELLRLQANAILELRRRGVVRTNNAPLGDYAEWLVANQLGLKLAGNSKAGYDAVSDAGVTYQIKSRRVTSTNKSRLLSAIRKYEKQDFDWLIAVIFNEEFDVLAAHLIPHEVIGEYTTHRDHVNGRIVNMAGPITQDNRVMEFTEQFTTFCHCCAHGTPTEGPRICPECGHTFASKHFNWDGIDAHWKANHEDVMPYREFFDNLCPAHRGIGSNRAAGE